MNESHAEHRPAGLDAPFVEEITKAPSKSLYEKSLAPVLNCCDGDLFVAACSVVGISYAFNLEADWVPIAFVSLLFLAMCIVPILRSGGREPYSESDGVEHSIYATIALFVTLLPIVTLASTEEPNSEGTCFRIAGCFRSVHWEYWVFFGAGVIQCASGFIGLAVYSGGTCMLHGTRTGKRIILLAILLAGLAAAGSYYFSMVPIAQVRRIDEAAPWLERFTQIPHWTLICAALWLCVYGRLWVEFFNGRRKRTDEHLR